MSDQAAPENHQFDRRTTDANVEALSVLVRGLTGRVEVLEEQGRDSGRTLDELKSRTQEVHGAVFGLPNEFAGVAEMTRDVHKALFGVEGKPGAMADIQAVRDLLEKGRAIARAADGAATGAGKFSDAISKALRRFWWLIFAAGAYITYVKTGRLPDIPLWPQ